jgi:hypothetical protein
MGSLRIIDRLMILDHLDRPDPRIHRVTLVLRFYCITMDNTEPKTPGVVGFVTSLSTLY